LCVLIHVVETKLNQPYSENTCLHRPVDVAAVACTKKTWAGPANVNQDIARPGADWAAWLPGTYQVGRLVRRPGGTPPRHML